MTRLVEDDVRALTARLDQVERALVSLTGCDLVALAARACGVGEGVARDALAHAAVAAVPITSGEGLIPGFVECVAAICAHLGCRARVTAATDVAGFAEALTGGDDLVFAADDRRFLALRLGTPRGGRRRPLHGARLRSGPRCGGRAGRLRRQARAGDRPRSGRPRRRRTPRRARRPRAGLRDRRRPPGRRHELAAGQRRSSLADGLARSRLVLDATPAPDLIDADWVGSDGVVCSPGLPPGVTAAAARALGERLVHEPLALGVAAMAVEALTAPRGDG